MDNMSLSDIAAASAGNMSTNALCNCNRHREIFLHLGKCPFYCFLQFLRRNGFEFKNR